jgi:hypothetical protein
LDKGGGYFFGFGGVFSGFLEKSIFRVPNLDKDGGYFFGFF